MFSWANSLKTALLVSFFAASPSSTNFTLKSYEFTTGGDATSSTNYALQSATGEQSAPMSSTSYKTLSGLIGTEQANVPPAPTFTNPSNEYNRLRLVIATGGNPTDTLYEVAISTDNFVSTYYVQTDNTVGTSNTLSQYQTYAAWGGAGGVWITGLASSTTYQVKVRALQGDFTGSAFGPTATAATVAPSITFSVATSLTGTPPYIVNFASLTPSTVVSAAATADIGLSTNSLQGGKVYVRSNGQLASASASFTIASASADLSIAASGYGAQVTSATQSSGGPFTSVSPFNGVTNNVGVLTTALQEILTSSAPVATGTGSITFKAKTTTTTPAATDYTDTVTFVAAMLY